MTRSAEAQTLSLGVIAHSRKPNERRLPIHPEHFSRIELRSAREYSSSTDTARTSASRTTTLAGSSGESAPASSRSPQCDVILLPKPQAEDLAELRDGQIVWGWPHCVQDAR